MAAWTCMVVVVVVLVVMAVVVVVVVIVVMMVLVMMIPPLISEPTISGFHPGPRAFKSPGTFGFLVLAW